jgi:hypothetical protein
MKIVKRFSVLAYSLLLCGPVFSQTLNFNSLKAADRHIISLNAGLEHGLIYGIGYAYQLKSKIPLMLNAEFSAPSGNWVFDDYKTKIGGQIRFFKFRNIHVAGKVQGIFRQNTNDYVQLSNFGSEVSATIGYYKRKWFTGVEVGFDKAIVTHFNHSNLYKEIYPGVQDGWYEPATGGNFNFGLLGGYSFNRSDIFLKAGLLTTEDFSKPALPFYTQLGYTIRFKKK